MSFRRLFRFRVSRLRSRVKIHALVPRPKFKRAHHRTRDHEFRRQGAEKYLTKYRPVPRVRVMNATVEELQYCHTGLILTGT